MEKTLSEGAKILELTEDDITEEAQNRLDEAARLDKEDLLEEENEDREVDASIDPDKSSKETKNDTEDVLDWGVFDDEKHPDYKTAIAVRDLYGSDPSRNEKHPNHKQIKDNQAATLKAQQELATVKREFGDYKVRYNGDNSSVGGADTDIKLGRYGGMTYEEAEADGKIPIWMDARDQYRDRIATNEAQKVRDSDNYDQAVREFTSKNPGIDLDTLINDYSTITFDQANQLSQIKSQGGLSALLEVAEKKGYDNGVIVKSKKISDNTTKTQSLNNNDGVARGDPKTKFVRLSPEEFATLDETGSRKYAKRLQKAMRDGDIPKTPLMDDIY